MFTTWPRRFVLIVALFLILGLSGLRVVHPHSGLNNSLGSARSGVAIYWAGNDYSIGTNIIYHSEDVKENPALGAIKGVDKKTYDVQNPKFLEMVKKENVSGRLIFIIPFIGLPLSLFGL